MQRKMLNGAFSHYAFCTVTNPLDFSFPFLPIVTLSSVSITPLLFLSWSNIRPPFLSPGTYVLSLPFPHPLLLSTLLSPSSVIPLSVRLSSSSGSPGSQSLHVWLSQRYLLYAALPAFGSDQDTAANHAKQCQAWVCVCKHHTHAHTHTHVIRCMYINMPLGISFL